MRYRRTNQRAFTILELMIASMVFSVILLLVTTGVVQIGRSYYKGILQSRTQETARNIMDEISRGIQFSGDGVAETSLYSGGEPYQTAGGRYGICAGGTAYSYIMGRQLRGTGDPATTDNRPRVLIAYRPNAGCSTYPTGSEIGPSPGGNPILSPVSAAGGPLQPNPWRELLGVGMRLTALHIVDNGNNTYTVTVGVASGESDLFVDAINNITGLPGTDGQIDSCASGAGNQFCAASRLTTTVQKRIQ